MDAIRTTRSNFTFLGPRPDIADLPSELNRPAGSTSSVWKLTDAERQAIADGAQVKLTVVQLPMPPVALEIVKEEEIVSPDETRCEACGALWDNDRQIKVCGHCGTELVRATGDDPAVT